MKVGMRTPSPEKMVKAKTTGRLKRAAKSSYNPVYGKKGIGYLKNPERAIKNKIYHKVTIDPLESIKNASIDDVDISPVKVSRTKRPKYPKLMTLSAFVGAISLLITLYKLIAYRQLYLVWAILAIIGYVSFFILTRFYVEHEEKI